MMDKAAAMTIIQLLRDIVCELRAMREDLRHLRREQDGGSGTTTADEFKRLMGRRGQT